MYAVLLFAGLQTLGVDACSRVIYSYKEAKSSKKHYMTARSMDWMEDTQSNLWSFPAEMERTGGFGEGSLEWTSKYGSIVTSVYGIASMDGMNTEGLGVNVLYLTEADYGNEWRENAGQKKMSIGAWGQYFLDMFATVADAVEFWKADDINIVAPPLPGGTAAAGHVAITDKSGDSAVFEYLKGHLVIHHGPEYTVMTNSPPFDQQLAITAYWKEIGGLNALPGTHRAADRFARLAWNLNAVPEVETYNEAVTIITSLIRHVSVPFGIEDPDKPNIASTTWRSVCHHNVGRYFFEPVNSPVTFWVDLSKLDLAPGDPVKKLNYKAKILAGESSAEFVPSPAFVFIKPGPEETPAPTDDGCPDCVCEHDHEMESLFGSPYTTIGKSGKLYQRPCSETPCAAYNKAACKANEPRCKLDVLASPKACVERKDFPCSRYTKEKSCVKYNAEFGATCSWDGSNCS